MKKYAGCRGLAQRSVSMSRLPHVLQAAVVTEKSTTGTQQGCYTFRVHPKASKSAIRQAVQAFFKVDVVKVNTLCVSPRTRRFRGVVGRIAGYKKAMVSLKKGQVIDAEGGVK